MIWFWHGVGILISGVLIYALGIPPAIVLIGFVALWLFEHFKIRQY